MSRRPVFLAAWALLALAGVAQAQHEVPRADSLLRAGQVARAERLYYAAARRRPRDPAARFALGRYLASRGALRVGIVLIEEARRFGGDPVYAASLLAPLHAQLGDFTAVMRLPGVRFRAGELARARWLQQNGPTVAGPDSARITLQPNTMPSSLGSVRLVIGGDTVRADVDPTASGIVLDRMHARTAGVRAFDAAGGEAQPAVLGRALLGPYLLRNVPVTLEDLGGAGRARIGFDWLLQWTPTIDPGHSRTLTLRRGGRVAPAVAPGSQRIPILFSLPGPQGDAVAGPWIAVPGGLARLDARESPRFRTMRLTLDPRRGELLIDR